MTLDIASLQAALASGLPMSVRWIVDEVPLDYDFSAARTALHPLSPGAIHGAAEAAWLELLIFGGYDCAEGGGAQPFLGIRKSDGAICGLDVEREGEALFLLNSSVEAFIRTFRFLSPFLSSGGLLPPEAESTLQAIDPTVYPESEWKLLVDHLS